uniref:Uncharacterized protein n=1 Tax=Candidatus Kentrum sp. TC TaxID=2126339 RepID=A0A451A565_9GAMM|nr:MAG: hypothetical protein BECKTC1821D_GA0114238_10834 [Candidatus Kentron sp. TC]VFK61189.1 MAG: hypothetical protein BECKTC1821F_GA0114240_105512 [Candidatus Kentron sp. TC]
MFANSRLVGPRRNLANDHGGGFVTPEDEKAPLIHNKDIDQ